MFNDWIQLFIKLSNNNFSTKDLVCPECGKKAIDYCYIGDMETKIGYLPMWCSDCNQGVSISRVKMPDNAKKIDFNDNEAIKKIPNFKSIY